MLTASSPFHRRVASLQRSHNALKIADRLSSRCAVASNAVYALLHRLERHAAAIILNMHKDNAAAWRLHNTLWGLLERCGRVVGAPRARCVDVKK